MATSFLPNLFSFFTPSKQPPPPPPSLPVSPPSEVSLSSTNRGFSSDELRSNPSLLSSSLDVIVDDNDSEEKLLGRFRREVMKAGVIQSSNAAGFSRISRMRRSAKHARLRSAIVAGALNGETVHKIEKKHLRSRRGMTMEITGIFLKEPLPNDLLL